MTGHFIEALMALSALLLSAAAVIKAIGGLKLNNAKLVLSNTKLARIESRLDDLDKSHSETREDLQRLVGYRDGHRNGSHK